MNAFITTFIKNSVIWKQMQQSASVNNLFELEYIKYNTWLCALFSLYLTTLEIVYTIIHRITKLHKMKMIKKVMVQLNYNPSKKNL